MTTDQTFRPRTRPLLPTASPAEVLSDAALDLAAGDVDVTDAAQTLVEQSNHNRGHMASAYTTHVQRMASRPSDDSAYQRALEIIATALRAIPRDAYPPFDASPPRPTFLRRIRDKISRPRDSMSSPSGRPMEL